MLTVHHLENSRSHRIIWLLEELGVDYDIEFYERDPQTKLAPSRLREIHPLGKSPVLTDGDHTIAESGAIIEYLVDTYDDDGALRPQKDSPEFERYRYWMHYAEGSAMSPLLLRVIFQELPRQGPWIAKPLLSTISTMVGKEYIDPQIDLHLNYWESELSARDYFAGDDFTAADIQMSFALEGVDAFRDLSQNAPHVQDLLEKLRERPAYERAIERGGELELGM